MASNIKDFEGIDNVEDAREMMKKILSFSGKDYLEKNKTRIDNTDTWYINFNRVYTYIKYNKPVPDGYFKDWYELMTRTYKSGRMIDPKKKQKWESLLDMLAFHKNMYLLEHRFFLQGKIPRSDSTDKLEQKIGEWFVSQEDPKKCLNSLLFNQLKQKYKQILPELTQGADEQEQPSTTTDETVVEPQIPPTVSE